jgi:hypothetical protein
VDVVGELSKFMPLVGFLIVLLWLVVPFSIFGLKPRIDALIEQQKLTNKLLADLLNRRSD